MRGRAMTDPILRLEPSQLSVEPGGQVHTTVTITNQSTIVEGFRLRIVDESGGGGPSVWGTITPDELPIYPKQSASAVVTFTPPGGRLASSGRFGFAVQAMSSVDATVSGATEGEIEVGKVFGLQSKLTPVTSYGRWRGLHTIQVSNWGNTPVRLRLAPTDPDQRLGFLVRPQVLDVPLGSTAVARLKVRTRKPFLRGTPVRLPFQVVGEPDPPQDSVGAPPPAYGDPRRPVLDGALSQKPVLSRGVVAVAGIAAAAIAAATLINMNSGSNGQPPPSAGPLAQPMLAAAAQPDGTVRLNWQPVPGAQSYTLITVDPLTGGNEASQTIAGSLTEDKTTVLTPNKKYCYELVAVGAVPGPTSAQACATAQAPPPPPPPSGSPSTSSSPSGGSTGSSGSGSGSSSTSPTATPTPTPTSTAFTAGQQIVLVGGIYTDDAKGMAQARADAFNLLGDGYLTAILHTSKYPKMQLVDFGPVPPGHLVLSLQLSPFQQALAVCQAHQKDIFYKCYRALPAGP
jgi:hypothetical protein